MERECFEDKEVSSFLNENFISVKVDREERPDIDSIYMSFCQVYTGSGGWPLTIIMTPDKKPFFAGTYFPKNRRYNMPGFMEVLNSINKLWKNDKSKVLESSARILKEIQSFEGCNNECKLDKSIMHEALEDLKKNFEKEYGGFSNAPKFPTPHYILFLLRYYYINRNEAILDMINKTLISMYKGGIFDHIGFGFSRYSTDRKWLVPHFEKMLYDNALLSIVYTEAYKITKNPLYKEVTDKILAYIKRDMLSEEGGFYSAEDADSEGVEGKFYLWDEEEIIEVLGRDYGELYCKIYGINPRGNFEGKSIPNLIETHLSIVENNKEKLEQMRERLFNYRNKRIHPYKDDKVLTSWNALMIIAFSKAARAFKNHDYKNIANKACKFIFENLMDKEGTVYTRFRQGEKGNQGFIEDYAFLSLALIELYETTFNTCYLEKSIEITNKMIDLFWDYDKGGFYLYSKNSEKLIVRPKEIFDGAVPSGNSVATLNLILLYYITGNESYRNLADKQFKICGEIIKTSPMYHLFSIVAYMYNIFPLEEITLSYKKDNVEIERYIDEINKEYRPFSIIILNDNSGALEKINPNIKFKENINDKITIYVCENYSCKEPIVTLEEFKKLLNKL